MILAVDLGTTAVKATAWSAEGLRAEARSTLVSERPGSGRVEQDAESWWKAAIATISEVTAALGTEARRIEALSFSTARQTIVAVDADLAPLGPAVVWSDRRASSVAGRLAWWDSHLPDLRRRARWVVGPRDLVVARLTGRVVTDVTVASRSGLYDRHGAVVAERVGAWADLLPAVVEPHEVVGTVAGGWAAQLGLRPAPPVVVGAGDRACEVIGVGATDAAPMVSWGTTANVSVPTAGWPATAPAGLVVSRAADRGWLLEGGLSGAGSLLDWLAGLTGASTSELALEAAAGEPGARGVFCLPWLDGARAPWWRSDASAGFVGVGAAHDRAHLARAAYEAVAADVARCLELMSPAPGAGVAANGPLHLCGGGSIGSPWPEILAGVTGRPTVGRAHPDAASVGAAVIGAAAVGAPFDVDVINPATDPVRPAADLVDAYRQWRKRSDEVAAAALGTGPADPVVDGLTP